MGCNIHVHIEVKKNDIWYHFSAPRVDRNYILFAVIAGVRMDTLRESDRNSIKPVAKIHQLPDDISFVTQTCYYQDKRRGLHDVGVLTAEDLDVLQNELYKLHPWVGRTGCDELDLEWSIFRTSINGNTLADHQDWDDLRVVFWFDN